jgi:WD40 repeat protein
LEFLVVDPYDWLGLAKGQRPPSLYQLLGLLPTVADPAMIRAAADRRFRGILPHLTGPNALEAERIWNELEDARDTLLDPDRRAHYDATMPAAESQYQETTAAPANPSESAAAESPLSPDELVAGSLPDPNPWWKSTPEAPSKADPWWRESSADEPAPPPPPVTTTPAPMAMPTVAGTPPSKKSPILIVVVGLIVAGVVVGGIYLGFGRKRPTSIGTPPPIVEGPKPDRKSKPTDSSPAVKLDEPIPETPLPKDFADQLRARTFAGHSGAVVGLAVANSGSRFVSVGMDKTLRIWSVAKGESIVRHTFGSPAVGVAWYGQDRRIAAADGFSVALCDPANSSGPRKFDSPRSGVTCLAVTEDGARALTGLSDGFVRLWNTGSGQADEWAVASRGPIAAVDISADGAQALIAVAEGPVSLWNMASRSRIHEWNPHPGGSIALHFSPDGTRAATSGVDGSAAIYDLVAKKEVCRLDGHTGPITGIAWLPDGQQAVTASMDGTARLWAASSGHPLRWLQALDGKGTCLAVDPGGRFVLVGTSTGTIHLFPLPRIKPETNLGPPAKLPAFPLAVPDPDAVVGAMTTIRNELKREFSYVRPEDMALLADNLRRRALVDRVPASLRFGLLQEARNLATKAGDAIAVLQAIDDLAAWFDVDELAEKALAIANLPPEADGPGLVALGLTAAERAEQDARPEIVERLLKRSSPNGNADLTARLAALKQRAAAAAAELKAVRQALEVLKNAPDDQASNQILGAFLCFAHQDWSTGLPMLAKGTDPRSIESAKLDLSLPSDPKAQHNLGELWFKLAIDQKDQRVKRAILGRARFWFERESKAKLEVADAVKARARLDDIAKLDVPSKDATTLPIFAPFHVRRAYNTLGPDVRAQEWRISGGAEGRADGVSLPEGSPVLASRFGLGSGGSLTLAFRPDGREIRINCAGQEFAFAEAGKAVRIAIERIDDSVRVTATDEDGSPVSRSAELPMNARGPLAISVRLTGTPARPGGALLTAAIVRGPVSIPLPLVE